MARQKNCSKRIADHVLRQRTRPGQLVAGTGTDTRPGPHPAATKTRGVVVATCRLNGLRPASDQPAVFCAPPGFLPWSPMAAFSAFSRASPASRFTVAVAPGLPR